MAKSQETRRETRGETRSDRVKFVYNAQFPAPTAVVLDYLLNNPHFTSRQGRQQGMDAISAFYRPMAEEARAELPEDEVREIARHCVEQLAKQIDYLCNRYQLENLERSGVDTGNLAKLEAVLESGFQTIAEALKSGGLSTGSNLPLGDSPISDLEQGVLMDGDELGELEALI
ncbi:MAG: hypothetical protein AAFV72_23680 [Cyanobacteria bacterium J06635_1]